MISLTKSQIKDAVDTSTFARGENYQRAGRVKELSLSHTAGGPYTLKAKVQGSGWVPYEVQIELKIINQTISVIGSCACPMGMNCKHVVAALLDAIATNLFNRATILNQPETPETQGVVPLKNIPDLESILKAMESTRSVSAPQSSEFDKWMRSIDSTLATNPTLSPTRNEDYQLLYVLKNYSYRQNNITVELFVARKLKRGGFSHSSKSFSSSSNTHMRALLPLDQDILHRLEVADRLCNSYSRGVYQDEYHLEGEQSSTLLSEILKTGRCFWDQHQDNAPLQLGQSKKGSLVWQIEDDGKQKLACLIEGKSVRVLPMTPLWYLDMPQKRTQPNGVQAPIAGPLEMDLDPKLAMTLLVSPSLAPQDIPKMEKMIKQKFQKTSPIPLPHQFKTTELKAVKPKPKLFLFGIRGDHSFFYKTYRYGCTLPMGRVSFIYDNVEVPIADPLTVNSVDRDSRSLRVISRHLPAEGECLKAFLEQGVDIFSKRYPSITVTHVKPFDFMVAPIEDKLAQEAFLHNALPALREAGWEILVDPSFPAKYVVEIDDWYTDVHETSEFDWFNMEVGFLMDGKKINILPLLTQLIEQYPDKFSEKYLNDFADETYSFILPTGQTVGLPVARIKGILATLTELYDGKSLDSRGLLSVSRWRAGLLIELEKAMQSVRMRWLGGDNLRELSGRLSNFKAIEPVKIPPQFKGALRDYQKTGVDWLNFLREYRLGGILSDDMGLGKTIQTLAHLLVEKQAGRMQKPCLIVAPTSLMENWRSETKQFAPSLTVLVLQGQARKEVFDQIQKVDIVLTTYPLIVRDKEVLLEQDYYMIILDEAQFIKNANTKAYLILQQIRTHHRLCLTGTPMENHLGELWSLFNFLSPGLLGESKQFTQIFRTPIEKHGNALRRQSLSQRLKPYLLRRTKEEVVLELPTKTEMIHKIVLEEAQLDLYESIRLAMESKVKKAIESKGFASSQIIILDALLKLRQACCDPRLLKLEQAKKVKESAKFTFLMGMLTELVEEGRKILLFSSFTSMLALIEEELLTQKMSYVKLTGSTTDRKTPIQKFQNGEVSIFLISLKAGGTGLNLTAADTVIHYDPWWNPAAEAQATDRAHRIGQTKPVFVYKLVTTGTVEEKILKMQEKKRALLDSIFDANQGKKAGKISADDLKFLFQPIEALEEEGVG